MPRSYSTEEILSKEFPELEWDCKFSEVFGKPAINDTWLIWGSSGSGKSSFVMQLCKELCKYDRVVYDSLEEGDSMTMQQSMMRHGMSDVGRRFNLLNAEPMEDLRERLSKRKSWNIAVIDSFQYTQMSYRDYIRLKEQNKDKLLIFISHAKGRAPRGSAAESVMYDATLKIWVEGFKAFSKGRFIGTSGEYTIWDEGAARYWGDPNQTMEEIR